MGMFDNLTCERELPEIGFTDEVFQTKDTNCQYLRDYKITEDNYLMLHDSDSEYVENDKSIFGFFIEHKNYRWVKENLTGQLYFYGNSGDFMAYFEDGKLFKIVKLDE